MVPDMFIVTEDNEVVFTRFIFKLVIADADAGGCGILALTVDGTHKEVWRCKDRETAVQNLDVVSISLARQGHMHVPQAIEAIAQMENLRTRSGEQFQGGGGGEGVVFPGQTIRSGVPRISPREAWAARCKSKDVPLPINPSDFDTPFNKEQP